MEPAATTPAPVNLDRVLDRLARFEPSHLPVISLYLNLATDKAGRRQYEPFLRKELPNRVSRYPAGSEARASLDRDVARITAYLASELPASARSLAIFACAGRDDFFEAVPLDALIARHRLSIAPEPHLYPLELVRDQHPPVALVLADSHAARIFVFALGRTVANATVEPRTKIKRFAAGGWSQMRFQRHVDELQAEHARELVAALEALVKQERIEHVVLAGDEVNVPLVKSVLPPDLAAKVIDVVRLEPKTAEHIVMREAVEALRRHDAKTDAEAVERVTGDYMAGGLASVGPADVPAALERGQVSELYLTAGDTGSGETMADTLVAKARQISASVRFIEDPALLEPFGGMAASLRYRLDTTATAGTEEAR